MNKEILNSIQANRERGFSILEVTMATLLTIGLMGGVFALMSRNQQVFVTESGVTEMNQNVRSVVDLLTQDIQSAGMGMPRAKGSFASLFYINGASNGADKLFIVNANPFAPTADISTYDDTNPTDRILYCIPPPEVTVDSSGNMKYNDRNGTPTTIYETSTTKYYLCYDDKTVAKFRLSTTGKGTMITVNGVNYLSMKYSSSSWQNLATSFGSAIDTIDPNRNEAKVALLGSLISYRINATTRELERTDDLTTYYPVARGITNIQFRFRTIGINNGVTTESIVEAPADRDNIRAVIVTVTAETPDYQVGNKNYRQVTHRFEVAPRNFNLLNNTNLSSNLN